MYHLQLVQELILIDDSETFRLHRALQPVQVPGSQQVYGVVFYRIISKVDIMLAATLGEYQDFVIAMSMKTIKRIAVRII